MAWKGKYKPKHPEKYDGNPCNIVYRSSLELRFCQYLDNSDNVVKWSSEEMYIWYRDPGRGNSLHRYFPDFIVTTKDKNGKLKITMVEIKPASQCEPPKQPAKKTRRYLREQFTWITNKSKWMAAESYCADRNWTFRIITDKDLKPR